MDWIVTIGPAKPGDAATIAAFLEAQGLPGAGVADHLGDFILARDDGRLVACVGLERHAEQALLRSLAVLPGHRGRGLGRRLAREALDRAARKGVERVWLMTETAIGLFASMGFVDEVLENLPPVFPEQLDQARGRCHQARIMRLDFA
ncbi:MAG: GNAT family N-acetyltransferase [Planctomycetes bacterium]|nr:GNAT family N-acetyltransferase [Planctomycetota bacterium]